MRHTGQDCSRDVDPGVLRGLGLPDAKYNPDVGSNTPEGTEPERIFEGARIMLSAYRKIK